MLYETFDSIRESFGADYFTYLIVSIQPKSLGDS